MVSVRLEVFRVNGWIFVQDEEEQTGTVYYPEGENTLPIACNYGHPGDSFPDVKAAVEHFQKTPVE